MVSEPASLTSTCRYILLEMCLIRVLRSEVLLLPSDCHRFGRAVTGDDGDETRVVCVLEDRAHGGSSQVAVLRY